MHILGRIIAAGALTVTTIALTACSSEETASSECTAADIDVSGDFGAAPTIVIPDDCDPPSELIVEDLGAGSGPGATPGQSLTMNYALVTWSDKRTLDSSFSRGEPFQLTLGAGQVIDGWDQGLVGVQQGARRLLIVPPELGYGEGGQGVAPNETLVFVTDAVSVGD
ncbi:FKBP-type peptidyl-prolyl cis-trans isomerase [Nocardia sp. CNY236]|uniref:FKBP-type peptidyl-prolyl cis-trans isomerase n=1 Tax=Nocardia sp. CNY236 TaxID=1169152 RepID=UPI000491D629|nr:FKBP-type peptidyl-prolyl cis-trans isomerase [Nocardia sp. CNY236]